MVVAVIGAGPAGLMAAGTLAKNGQDVTIFDGNEKAGKKIYITGKGRCNVTNLVDPAEFLASVVNGGKFLFSSIYSFNSYDAYALIEQNGTPLKVERGNRVFPVSDRASDITQALTTYANGCRFKYNEHVLEIKKIGNKFEIITRSGKSLFDRVVIATGGKTYSATGSTGDGYSFAKAFGHNIIEPAPALSAILLNNEFVKNWEGISLKNVKLIAKAEGFNKEFFGEMLFTDRGISGPITLSMSSYINRLSGVSLYIDFKPALTHEKLEARILREFEDGKNKDIKNIMASLLPSRMGPEFLKACGISESIKVNSITKEMRMKIIENLKGFKLDFKELERLDFAIVTSGGVDTNQVNPKTMESKLVKGLFFAGEVLNLDALTGGFNIQIAMTTGFAAGNA